MRGHVWMVVVTVAMVFGAVNAVGAGDIPWVEEKSAPDLPDIFQERPARQRLMAEEVARLDAYRKLLERAYGLSLSAEATVRDLVLESREIDTALRNELRGMREVAKKYQPDGRVEIAVTITVRKVVEIIETTYKRVKQDDRVVSEEVLKDVKRENRDTDITVVGRGALRDSPGLERIRALRAAEVDCYERVAGRVFGLNITSETTVRDFVLQSDRIKSDISVELPGGVRFTRYQFFDDGSCAATGKITLRKVIEILERTYRRHTADAELVKLEDIQNLSEENEDVVITEVGRGTVREFEEKKLGSRPDADVFEEEKTAVKHVLERTEERKRVIDTQVGVED